MQGGQITDIRVNVVEAICAQVERFECGGIEDLAWHAGQSPVIQREVLLNRFP